MPLRDHVLALASRARNACELHTVVSWTGTFTAISYVRARKAKDAMAAKATATRPSTSTESQKCAPILVSAPIPITSRNAARMANTATRLPGLMPLHALIAVLIVATSVVMHPLHCIVRLAARVAAPVAIPNTAPDIPEDMYSETCNDWCCNHCQYKKIAHGNLTMWFSRSTRLRVRSAATAC
jgi:hypothetical protein